MRPILLDFPSQIETERLILRAPRPGDGLAVHAGIRESLAELQASDMPWINPVPTLEDSEAFARESAAKFVTRADLVFYGFLKESGEFVLSTGLHPKDWKVPSFEIGYWVRTSLSRHGYVTEAAAALTEFARAQLAARRVMIRMFTKNERSRLVPERLGYRLEGTTMNQHRHSVTGEMWHFLTYAKTFD